MDCPMNQFLERYWVVELFVEPHESYQKDFCISWHCEPSYPFLSESHSLITLMYLCKLSKGVFHLCHCCLVFKYFSFYLFNTCWLKYWTNLQWFKWLGWFVKFLLWSCNVQSSYQKNKLGRVSNLLGCQTLVLLVTN